MHWTMQSEVLQTWMTHQGPATVMEVAPILTIFLYESERMFFIIRYMFEMFRMYA